MRVAEGVVRSPPEFLPWVLPRFLRPLDCELCSKSPPEFEVYEAAVAAAAAAVATACGPPSRRLGSGPCAPLAC